MSPCGATRGCFVFAVGDLVVGVLVGCVSEGRLLVVDGREDVCCESVGLLAVTRRLLRGERGERPPSVVVVGTASVVGLLVGDTEDGEGTSGLLLDDTVVLFDVEGVGGAMSGLDGVVGLRRGGVPPDILAGIVLG